MSLFDQIKKEAKDLAGKASQAATRAQVGLEMDALQQRIDKLLIKAGHIAVQMQRARVIDDSTLKELSADLAALESRMSALRAQRDGTAPEPEPAPQPEPAPADPAKGPVCPNCQQAVEMDQAFCGNCGERLSACVTCGIIVLSTDEVCAGCGADLV